MKGLSRINEEQDPESFRSLSFSFKIFAKMHGVATGQFTRFLLNRRARIQTANIFP